MKKTSTRKDLTGINPMDQGPYPKLQHTLLPWTDDLSTIYADRIAVNPDEPTNDIVGTTSKKADAAFIVRAVNSHEKMLTTLKHALAALNSPKNESLGNDVYEEILSVITQAEGKSC